MRLEDVRAVPAFTYRWPDTTENFDRGWEATVVLEGTRHRLRHGIGNRVVYGSARSHSVTFIDGQPAVEATAEDAYAESKALVSLIKGSDRRDVRERADLPAGYEGFEILRQAEAIDALYVRSSLVVRLAEDDLESWARLALLRLRLRRSRESVPPAPRQRPTRRAGTVEVQESQDRAQTSDGGRPVDVQAVVDALLAHGATLAERDAAQPAIFTQDPEANSFLLKDPFAFLVAVICDQGIRAERAWAVPFVLRRRLGHLDPARLAREPDRVVAAFQERPMLHRLVNVVPAWISDASRRVVAEYGGDAGRIWADTPSAMTVQARLCRFKGISQKKAAMAVEILERDLGVPIGGMEGSDVAYDVHVRRVFLRTGLAVSDDIAEIVSNARALHPERPGSLDFPSWDIGRRWCRPENPRCEECVLWKACPRLIDRAVHVQGM
jgi:uncharacterized HhH-GPD family protein